MNFASRVAVGSMVALSFTAAGAEDAPTNEYAHTRIAHAGDAYIHPDASHAPAALDVYAGRYHGANGVAFLVDRDGDTLTIELPEGYGPALVRLHAAAARNTFTTDTGMRLVFDSDASGRVLGLLFHTAAEVIAASKTPAKRGIVTIHDLSEEAAASLRLDSLVRSF